MIGIRPRSSWAIVALFWVGMIPATRAQYASEVVDFTAVGGPAGTELNILGFPDCQTQADFYSVGSTAGFVTVSFDEAVVDRPGDDVILQLTGFQPNQLFVEDFYFLASDDGVTFSVLGYRNPNDFDFAPLEIVRLGFDLALGGLTEARYFKVENGAVVPNTNSEGPDICGFEATSSELTVEIDIKPGSDTNPINPRSHGVVPVAILTTPEFDASMVDSFSVVFGPSLVGVAHAGHLEDVDNDGDIDWLGHFRDPGITCGATEASLSGTNIMGEPFEGSDTIQTVGCHGR